MALPFSSYRTGCLPERQEGIVAGAQGRRGGRSVVIAAQLGPIVPVRLAVVVVGYPIVANLIRDDIFGHSMLHLVVCTWVKTHKVTISARP